MPQSPATRPEELGVTPWYFEDSPSMDASPGPTSDRGSYPMYVYGEKESNCKTDLNSTRNSSIESEMPRPQTGFAPRKAYMDLKDAIALLDETCPNQEPSPSLTPRTPRTPLTPYPRNKRARSKSSDNSSNYSNDRLSDRSFENSMPQEKEKKRPFLRKIGISKTEDRPFLAKFTPRIIGKPYLEKIGPSKAVEKPFLDKIGSSKTVDKFTFDTPRSDRAVTIDTSSVKRTTDQRENVHPVQAIIEKENEKESKVEEQMARRRRSGKGFLSKMYSFETEDLDETTVQPKDHRDPLRGISLEDVLDSGPSSLPPIKNEEDRSMKPELEQRPTSAAELLKCRVTTSEEIISSSSCIGSPRELNSWANSPRRRRLSKRSTSKTPTHRKTTLDSRETLRSDESTPNSPTKRPISNVSPECVVSGSSTLERNSTFSPTKTRRQTLEDIMDKNGESKGNEKINKHFERRGISSDNLLSRDAFAYVTSQPINSDRTREATSEDSLAIRRDGLEYSKETFKQLQDKFEMRETFTETYAAFKRRTRGTNFQISTIDRMKNKLDASETQTEAQKDTLWKTTDIPINSTIMKPENKVVETPIKQIERTTTRSVLKKQEGVDHPSDHEADVNGSLRRPKRRIFHEPSQETMDLLTELRKVKSLLKTPSWEKDYDLDKKPTRLPKRILLTDKEFCLSVERDNSIRRPSRTINVLERTEESILNEEQTPKQNINKVNENQQQENTTEDTKNSLNVPGPALFEENFLSLDYADDEKPQKPEILAISLTSIKNVPSELEESNNYPDLGLICDTESYSDVFNTPSEEINEKEPNKRSTNEFTNKINRNNHCAEIDIAIPIDQKTSSPKGKVSVQSRTSDLYEIISPRSTPFRMKKRLGKISVEEAVKPENFTLGSKVDCRSVVQKRTKCFPL